MRTLSIGTVNNFMSRNVSETHIQVPWMHNRAKTVVALVNVSPKNS